MFARFGLLLFTTGFCALVYQVTWLRLLRHVFGGSTAATAAVLAIFMGGLGLGGALMARRPSLYSGRPLAFYARLEIGIALSAAASPWLIDLVRLSYGALAGMAPLGSWASTLLRLLLSALVLVVPTTLMGATLPALAHALERENDPGRRRTAAYYGLNALGAVFGALAATFVAIELLGIRRTLLAAAAVNLAAALIARRLASGWDRQKPPPSDDAGPEPPPVSAPVPMLLATAFGVGFVFFLMEIVWYRMLAPILGGSSFTFGLILATALLGIAAGGLLFSRRRAESAPLPGALAWTCALEGLCLALPFLLGDRLAILAASLRGLEVYGFAGLAIGWASVTAIVVLPTAIVAGYQFPLLVALLGGGRERVAPEVGAAAASNTFGAIAGSLAGGFGLLPLFGATWLWRFDVWLLAGLSVALALAGRRAAKLSRLLPLLAVAGLAIAATLAEGPSSIWRQDGIGAGRFELPATPFELKARRHRERAITVAARDGVESHFALVAEDELALINNGKSDGSAVVDSPTAILLGLAPALLHPEPREALVIGLGSGATAGWLAEVESIERVDVVELEPLVGELARHFAPVNRDALDNPKIALFFADGRAWVQTTPNRYDLIVSEPSNPYRAGVADLFSRDFYRSIAGRLQPNGLLAQWLQGYDLDSGMARMVSASLRSVFGHVEIWQLMSGDLMFVASAEPLPHDFDRARQRVIREPWRSALAKSWQVAPSAESFYSGFIGSGVLVEALAHGAEISTDDRPLLELGFARRVGRGGDFEAAALVKAARRLGAHLPSPARGEPLDLGLLEEARILRYEERDTAATPDDRAADAWQRHRARAEFDKGRPLEAAYLWTGQDQPPRHPFELLLMALHLARSGDARAAELAAHLATEVDRELVLATLANNNGERPAAFDHLLRCWGAMRAEAFFHDHSFRASLTLGRALVDDEPGRAPAMFEALSRPLAVHRFEPERLAELSRLSLLLPPESRACVAVFAEREPYPLWTVEMLQLRHRCYARHGHPLENRAARDLALALEQKPEPFDDLGGDLP